MKNFVRNFRKESENYFLKIMKNIFRRVIVFLSTQVLYHYRYVCFWSFDNKNKYLEKE